MGGRMMGGTMGKQDRGATGAGMVMRMMFSLMDADGERIFRGMDQNKDGRLTMEEMQSFIGAGTGR
jgi:hypothetical protein